MAKIVAIVGKSKSGKTTLIERLIRVFSSKGLKVATAKHTFHKLNVDKPGKDTWRHIESGSKATALSTSDALMLIKHSSQNEHLHDLIRIFDDEYDLIIAEGFKESDLPKIVVQRSGDKSLIIELKNVIAVATSKRLDIEVEQFSLNDIDGIADFIEKHIINP